MSCWSGFWFFVSCHSVMAFPSFTIRWTGAEMLYFHFPVVGNSRWPGNASFSVLLHEQFTTWSATCFGGSSCRRCSYSTRLTWAFPDQHIGTHVPGEECQGGVLGWAGSGSPLFPRSQRGWLIFGSGIATWLLFWVYLYYLEFFSKLTFSMSPLFNVRKKEVHLLQRCRRRWL